MVDTRCHHVCNKGVSREKSEGGGYLGRRRAGAGYQRKIKILIFYMFWYNGRIGIIVPLQKQRVADFEH